MGFRAGHPKYGTWYTHYFELKLLKKQLVQEGHSDSPLCSLKEGNKFPMGNVLSLYQKEERGTYHQREGIQG